MELKRYMIVVWPTLQNMQHALYIVDAITWQTGKEIAFNKYFNNLILSPNALLPAMEANGEEL